MRQSQHALMTDHDLVRYFAQRAGEYEKIYARPERQHDLAIAARWLQSELAQRNSSCFGWNIFGSWLMKSQESDSCQ